MIVSLSSLQEGFFAFWTGFSAYYMRTAPHAMIILLTQQPFTQMYKKTFVENSR
jgi:hypothetical protein